MASRSWMNDGQELDSEQGLDRWYELDDGSELDGG